MLTITVGGSYSVVVVISLVVLRERNPLRVLKPKWDLTFSLPLDPFSASSSPPSIIGIQRKRAKVIRDLNHCILKDTLFKIKYFNSKASFISLFFIVYINVVTSKDNSKSIWGIQYSLLIYIKYGKIKVCFVFFFPSIFYCRMQNLL